ncbi:hypothetical protein GCM10027160_36550 [Streptomyces calidiresistens]|uniref:Htaa domain-containing protein n=1 Tax=Streptomyces calidiresistens TaxID=1485586 RepID=A0A7W3T0W3_9ACTN|nr:HtaA domain-containing protein [Streptomyces calidiresistens]MBB0228808.1 hypothetical protein [Streptomyces calidiresistens]
MTAHPVRTARRGALLLAAATATVLSATALTVPVAAADDGNGRPTFIGLENGTLDWGIKQSFRNYLGLPFVGGSITVGDGAGRNADGTFRFVDGAGTYTMATHGVDAGFNGSVHFTGHHGDLDLEFSDLRFVSDRVSGSILADVTANGETSQDVPIAELDIAGATRGSQNGAMVFGDIPATLTEEGAAVFAYNGNPFYAAGDALDPVTLTISTASSGGGNGGSGNGGSGNGGSGDNGGSDGSGDNGGSEGPGDTGNGGSDGPGDTGNGGSNGSGDNGGSGDDGGSDGSGGNGNGGSGDPGGNDGGSEGSGDGSNNGAGDDGGTDGSGGGDGVPSGTIEDGVLDWGVKQSFRSYVTGPIASGRVELSDGATGNGAGSYRFPDGSGDLDAEEETVSAGFRGTVTFLGHEKADGEYELELKFSSLAVELNGTSGELIADISSKDRATGEVTEATGVTVANLTVPASALTVEDDLVVLEDLPAVLTADGAEAFGGFYAAGDDLDPVSVALALAEGVDLPDPGSSSGGTGNTGGAGTGGAVGGAGTGGLTGGAVGGALGGGALASTGSNLPTSALVGGAVTLAAGGAVALWAVRRRSVAASGAGVTAAGPAL